MTLALVAALLPAASTAAPPLHVSGRNLAGEAAEWTAPAGTLAVIVAVPAPSCPGSILGVLDALSLLLERRGADLSAVVVGVGGIGAAVAARCPKGATLLAVTREALPPELPVPGLPPMPVVPEQLARDLERYFTLPE